MGKVDRLHIKVKHFVALIFANLTLTLPACPASLHRPTGSMTIYCKDMLGSILEEDALPPPFLFLQYLVMLFTVSFSKPMERNNLFAI